MNVVGRVLLVLTTNGSDEDLHALQCHAMHWARNPLAHTTEVLLHSTRALNKDFVASFQSAFISPMQKHVTVTPPRRSGNDKQAIDTFVKALNPYALSRYNWVIASAADVIIMNASRLLTMLSTPNAWAILANCNNGRRCTAGCIHGLVQSDFFAFRPSEVRFHNETLLEQKSETYVTQIFYPAIALKHDAWIQARGFKDRSCRIRAGVRGGRRDILHYRDSRCNKRGLKM